ncbi:MAG: histidine--tRNA ligase [Hydrogenophaga sp.]|uniref:histidine--tRNA ligase n=1 Tax=Hydrogenophaga sp. TaxID=1904254 RepID=UPI0016A451A1|nr:histidine--tRNA ligase [Hydrogenophaga sp.]NIM43557.1 histidine--tRNA ligase [Hydrogenophaga sp.]NIN28626.1 histidine--tRNA ligase [Hydrogenophaga sp.]NIN33085.1 histidine--tRNA ligase [Hydrogenophaga sp.]NIN57760.1 histidine--tRNA ligase [Hydrogenophaga sp.]NIO54055.1 histidine--tRNA ligase [Hydrogenophaga sp.]
MAEKLVAVKGMNDIAPPQSAHWEWLEDQLRALMARYGYRNLRTPIVEPTALFVRGLGEVTDIVEKEMYSFEDKLNGEQLTLRPENTAGVVRAALESNMLYEGPKRLYYMGPMFRHERPQRGRYRQFHQVGAEALGFAGPDVDVELIVLASDLWATLGLTGIELEINSLGQPAERLAHRQALIAHFESHASLLDEDAKRRLHSNPLRILDTKNPAMQDMVNAAPQLIDHLGPESLAHFDRVKALLDAHGIAYRVNPRLVRGMDYYNLTVFEFVTTQLGSQGTVCAGGRYDGLFEQIGGKPTPAVGWALGMERILELLKEQGRLPEPPTPDAYAVVPDAASLSQVMPLLRALRQAGARVQMHAAGAEGMGSMKSQFKKADASGARFALIFGADELAQGQVALKPLRGDRDAATAQWVLPLADPAAIAARLRAD